MQIITGYFIIPKGFSVSDNSDGTKNICISFDTSSVEERRYIEDLKIGNFFEVTECKDGSYKIGQKTIPYIDIDLEGVELKTPDI